MRIDQLDTPALVIDLDIVEVNIIRAQRYANQHNLKLRPHIKTHKLASIAKMQLDHGAVGINCQKVSEACSIVQGLGPSVAADVLITFNILGKQKLKKLVQLASECSKLTVVADNEVVLNGYIAAAAQSHWKGSPPLLNIMVECDTGGLRAGVTDPAEALKLAKIVVDAEGKGVKFAGLMTYPAAGKIETLKRWLEKANALFKEADIAIPDISVGGTPDMWKTHEIGAGVTEMRPGTYVYNDRAILRSQAAELEWCAQTVLSTVVSRPTPTRAVCDAGSKALSMDLLGLEGHGHILEFPRARIARISEEHGVIEADSPDDMPQIGDRIRIVPNHACVVTNLFNEVYLKESGMVSSVKIQARGAMQ